MLSALHCTSDNKSDKEPKTEIQLLEAERDSAKKKIDSIKSEIKKLEKRRDSLKAVSADTLETN
jgi:hypothetical protein